MTNPTSVSIPAAIAREPLAWPAYPGVLATLLAAIGVTTLFIGLSAVTSTTWFMWIGLALMAIVIGLHLRRVWQTRAKRAQAREQLNATFISECRSLASSTLLLRHNLAGEKVILLLAGEALHVAQCDPLAIITTVPLYNVERAALTGSPADPVLNVSVRTNGERIHTLALTGFEQTVPATTWARALGNSDE